MLVNNSLDNNRTGPAKVAACRVIVVALLFWLPPHFAQADARSIADDLAQQAYVAEQHGLLNEAISLRLSAWRYYKVALSTNPRYPMLQEWNDDNLIKTVPDLVKTHKIAVLRTVLRAMSRTPARGTPAFPLITQPLGRKYFNDVVAWYERLRGLETYDRQMNAYYWTKALEAAQEGQYKRSKQILEYALSHRPDRSLDGQIFTYLLGAVELALGEKTSAISNFYATLIHRYATSEPGLIPQELAAATYLSNLPRVGL